MTPQIRRLVLADFDQYYAVRLAGLVECPAAFTTDAEAWRSASRETIERHLESSRGEASPPILGAWTQNEELVGLIGLSPEQRPAVSHKAGIWGFYVTPQHRGRGIGRALLADAVSLAGELPGLRHLRAVVPTSCGVALLLFEHFGFQRYGLEPQARFVDGAFHDQAYLWYELHTAA
jgi:ribosomal protein S18 acetylase RimI-like enzyme